MFRVAADAIDYPWEVSEWNAACSNAQKCTYKFLITADGDKTSSPQLPSVQARCAGQGPGAEFAQCEIIEADNTPTAVSAKLLPSPPSSNFTMNGTLHPAEIEVSVQHIDFENSMVQWNYTGSAVTSFNGDGSALSFAMTPSQVWAIA